MTTHTNWRDDIDLHADDLHALLRAQYDLNLERAPVYAAYGTYGTWENRRKVVLSTSDVDIRATAEKTGSKVTDKGVDALAHSTETYRQMIDDAEAGRTRLAILDAQLLYIEGLIAKLRAEDYARRGP